MCLKTVTVPKSCVICANSLLTRKFTEENCIIVGNLTDMIKRNVN